MNLKQQQKIESKERILNVASRLFKKNGFSATGIDQIMAESGLTAGGFYAHFKSKNDLLEQVIEHSFKFSKNLLFKDLDGLSDQEKLKIVMQRYVSTLHRDLPEKGCIIPALASEIHRTTKKSAQIVGLFIQKWAEFIAQQLPGELPYEQKKQKALKLISQAVGAVLLSRMTKETDLSDQILSSVKP